MPEGQVYLSAMKSNPKKTMDFDLDLFLPYLLNQAAEVTSRNFQVAYRVKYAMTRTQWRVMANLGKHAPMTASEICRTTFIEKTKMSRAVQALVEKGFLSRATIVGDRRSEMLSLTSKGKAVFREVGLKATAYDLSLRKRLGADVADTLEKMLRTLTEAPD